MSPVRFTLHLEAVFGAWTRRRHGTAEMQSELGDEKLSSVFVGDMVTDHSWNAASAALGNPPRGAVVMQVLWADIRYSVRLLRRAPSFSLVAVASLTLGIGASTAVFSLLNAVVLRSLPVPHPEQLARLATVRPNAPNRAEGGFSFPAFEEIGRRQQVFDSVIGFSGDGIFNVEANGTLVRGDVWAVTGNFYRELGVVPFAGRLLGDTDVDLAGRAPARVVVLGYGVWRREFGGDVSIVGRDVRIEGASFTVIGIAPRGFTALGITTEPDVTIPLTAFPLITAGTPLERLTELKLPWIEVVGRLRSGITLSEARAQLSSAWPAIRLATLPPDYAGRDRDEFLGTRLEVTSAARGREWFLRSRFTSPLYVILGVAGLILFITCVNLASLMLSRAAARSHELSVRTALGASRWRLVRQLMLEGLLLSAFGAAGGLLFASWSGTALATLMTRDYLVPSALDVSMDARVLAFTAGTAALSAILVTLVPAWRSARQEPAAALQQNARALTNTGRTGKALIVTQVALSVVLLTDAALLVRTLQNLRSVRYGFDPEGVSLAGLFPEVNGYQDFDPDRYEPELVARVAALPGVRVAALTRARPGFLESKQLVALAGSTGANVRANFGPIGPRFLEALRVPLLAGRDLQWSDNSRSRRVALVSRSLAERLMPGGDVLGRRVRIGTDPGRRDLEIVGVVGDARLYDPRDPDPNTVYVPMLQEATYTKWATLIVRADAPIAAAGLRERVRSLRRESLLAIGPLQRTLDRAILQERVTAMIAGFFGALAALLAAIGLYGLMAYAVAQRRREIGVRLALGARPGEVIRMVVLETMGLVVAGVAVGVPLALATSRAVRSLLFGLSPGDPVTIIGIVAMLLLIGAVAGFVPGRLASRINPIDALRV